MSNPKFLEEAFDLVQEINDHDGFLDLSLNAIDSRLCELQIIAKKTHGIYKKGDSIVTDNITYRDAVYFLRGFSYGRHLPRGGRR